MDFADVLTHLDEQTAAFRAAVTEAGPDLPTPTCPEWTVQRLTGHVGTVRARGVMALRTPRGDEPGPIAEPPAGWADVLEWFDAQHRAFVAALREVGPDHPAWAFPVMGEADGLRWARRQLHETAIHRLDAEHALDRPVPSLLFGSTMAADGVDEYLALILPLHRAEHTGLILLHAADAERHWFIGLSPGEQPGVVDGAAVDADVRVVGTADAVYRALWRRPSPAVVTGDVALLSDVEGR